METIKLQKIDELLLREHSCLTSEDYCYFLGEYAGGQGYQHSDTNQLIHNLKKPSNKKNQKEWAYKEKAIITVAELLMSTTAWPKLKKYTWVPIPPSSTKTHSEYDDRLVKVLNKMREFENNLDLRELLTSIDDRQPAHLATKRFAIEEHYNNLKVDLSLREPPPNAIVIFDDVILSGAGYKAAKLHLSKIFPNIPIIGIFIARAVLAKP